MEAGTRHTALEDGGGWSGEGQGGMENLTTILRQAREHKGVSLQDAEEKTRIPLKYLQALEGGGESGLLADEMYLIPFLRSYANFLGIDANQAVTRFLTELQRQDAATVAPPERRPPMVTSRSGPSRLASWILPFLLVLVALVIGPYLWQQGYLQTLAAWWQSGTATRERTTESTAPTLPSSPPAAAIVPNASVAVVPPPSTPESSPSAQAAAPADVSTSQKSATSDSSTPVAVVPRKEEVSTTAPATQVPKGEPTPSASAPIVAAAPPTTVAPPAGKHHLTIQANSPTWMRVIVDSQPGKEMILKAGESREWAAKDGFILSFGNAGGVTLNLDGQEIPPVGKVGQVVRNLRIPAPTTGQ